MVTVRPGPWVRSTQQAKVVRGMLRVRSLAEINGAEVVAIDIQAVFRLGVHLAM